MKIDELMTFQQSFTDFGKISLKFSLNFIGLQPLLG